MTESGRTVVVSVDGVRSTGPVYCSMDSGTGHGGNRVVGAECLSGRKRSARPPARCWLMRVAYWISMRSLRASERFEIGSGERVLARSTHANSSTCSVRLCRKAERMACQPEMPIALPSMHSLPSVWLVRSMVAMAAAPASPSLFSSMRSSSSEWFVCMRCSSGTATASGQPPHRLRLLIDGTVLSVATMACATCAPLVLETLRLASLSTSTSRPECGIFWSAAHSDSTPSSVSWLRERSSPARFVLCATSTRASDSMARAFSELPERSMRVFERRWFDTMHLTIATAPSAVSEQPARL